MDGQDYEFREKVAAQYKARVVLKSQLKKTSIFTLIPCLFIIFHVLQVPAFPKLPMIIDIAGKKWQQVYAFSFITPLISLVSMKKNSVLQITLSILTNLGLSLIPVSILAYHSILSSAKHSQLLLAFAMATFFLHFMVLKQSLRLRASWKENKTK